MLSQDLLEYIGTCSLRPVGYSPKESQLVPHLFLLSDKDPHFIHTLLRYLFTQLLGHTAASL